MKDILFIAKMSEFKNENSSNRYYFLEYLKQKSNIMVLDDTNILLDLWFKTNYHFKPDVIIYYFLSKGERLMKISISDFKNTIQKLAIPSVMIFEDSHYIKTVNKLYNFYKFDYFIQLYSNLHTINLLKEHNIAFKQWNHYINTDIFKNFEIDKEYDFLFYGYINSNIYPLRTKVYKVLQQLQITHPNIKINIIDHISYSKDVIDLPKQQQLAELINKSRFSFSTSSIYDLFLKKYIEIPLCGTTLIGNIPIGYEAMLKNKIIEIDENQSLDEIKNVILNAYNNEYFDTELNATFLTRELKENYSYEKGYLDLNNIVSSITKEVERTKFNSYRVSSKTKNMVFSINNYNLK